jgi:hypothetical protein
MNWPKADFDGPLRVTTLAGLQLGVLTIVPDGKNMSLVELPSASPQFYDEQRAKGTYLPWNTRQWVREQTTTRTGLSADSK